MKTYVSYIFIALLLPGFSTEDHFLDELNKKFHQYQENSPHFKVNMIFNQDKYVAGDTVWFSAYLFTENNFFVSGNHLLNLYLLNEAGGEIDRWSMEAKDGQTYGQIVLKNDLEAGIYQVVCHSDWMRNFDSEFFYRKTIEVSGVEQRVQVKQAYEDLMVFPEGGHLVAGISNHLFLKASITYSGQQVQIKNGNNIITTAILDTNALTSCYLTPIRGENYTAEVNGKSVKLPLVEVDYPGLILTEDKNEVKLLITTEEKSQLRQSDLYLVMTSQGSLLYSAKVKTEKKLASAFLFPKQDLPDGVIRLTILDSSHKVLGERFFYNKADNNVLLSATTDQMQYAQRDKINLHIELAEPDGQPLKGIATVKVLNGKYFDQTSTWTDDLQWKDDAGSLVRDWVSEMKPETHQLNQLLISQQNGKLNWENIWNEKQKPEFRMSSFFHLRGKILDKSSNLPPTTSDSVNLILFVPGQMLSYELQPEKDGAFDIPFVFGLEGEQEIMYFIQEKGATSKRFKVNREPVPQVASLLSQSTPYSDPFNAFANRLHLIDAAYTENEREVPVVEDLNKQFELHFGKMARAIMIQEYVVFPNMVELIREIIPNLQHRSVGGKTSVRVVLQAEKTIFPNDDPLYVIDGVPTKDTGYFLNLKPGELLEVNVINNYEALSKLGVIGLNGIVLVKTTKPGRTITAMDVLKVNGFIEGLPFLPPNYNKSNEAHIPDFRTTIFWKPNVALDKNGQANVSFYHGDDVGPMQIIIEGITWDGRPFSKQLAYHVSQKSSQ